MIIFNLNLPIYYMWDCVDNFRVKFQKLNYLIISQFYQFYVKVNAKYLISLALRALSDIYL